MKSLTTTIFFLISIALSGQYEIGQTRDFIIKNNSSCFVDTNDDTVLILNCDGYLQMYFFTRGYLCNLVGFEIPEYRRQEFIKRFTNDSLVTIWENDVPLAISVRKEVERETSPAILFSDDEVVISILEHDLLGSNTRKKIAVYIQDKPN